MAHRFLLFAGPVGILMLAITSIAALPDDVTPFEEWGFRVFSAFRKSDG